jgi:hypothetical protein
MQRGLKRLGVLVGCWVVLTLCGSLGDAMVAQATQDWVAALMRHDPVGMLRNQMPEPAPQEFLASIERLPTPPLGALLPITAGSKQPRSNLHYWRQFLLVMSPECAYPVTVHVRQDALFPWPKVHGFNITPTCTPITPEQLTGPDFIPRTS